MSIFLNKDSTVIVQGITGGEGTKHTALMLKAGTKVVGGVNARKAGTTVQHDGGISLPVFGTVAEAIATTGADVSIVFVPPAFAKDAVLSPELVAHFGSFDLVVSYLFDPNAIFETNLKRCGIKRFIAGPAKLGSHEHAAQQLARPLEQLGLRLESPSAKIYPSDADREFATLAGQPPGGDIFIHGHSYFRGKNKGDWTAGCIAVTDKEVEVIYSMVKPGTFINILP